MRERAADLAALLADPNTYFYVCGLKAMEEGVVLALRDIAQEAGLDWDAIGAGAQARRPAAPRDLLIYWRTRAELAIDVALGSPAG